MTYLSSETGAVTVDWVVLTAGLVGLGLATMAVVSSGVQDAAEDTSRQVGSGFAISSSFGQMNNNEIWQAFKTFAELVQQRPPGFVSQHHSDPALGFQNEVLNIPLMPEDEFIELWEEDYQDTSFLEGRRDQFAGWQDTDGSVEALYAIYPTWGSVEATQAMLDNNYYGDPDLFARTTQAGIAYELLLAQEFNKEAERRGLE